MAKILTIRKRATGAEICVDDNGKERVFWKLGYQDGEDLGDWVDGVLTKVQAAESAEATVESNASTAISELGSTFVAWIKDNKGKDEVKYHLKALAKIYLNSI